MENNRIEVSEVRDIGVITTEIKTLVRQFQNLTLSYAIEVGRRLKEAKELLPHGAFGDWLKENVSFSTRQANNLMQLFDAYGGEQITLFGAVPKSQAIADLPVTKAIRLLALPEDEREEMLENEDVAGMSTRELEAAIKARRDAEEKAQAVIEEAERLQEIVDRQDAELQAGKADKLALVAAEERVRKSFEARDAAFKELAQARQAAEDAKAQVELIRKNPVPPEKLAEIENAAKAAAIAEEAEKRKAEKEKIKKNLEKAEADARAKVEDAERRVQAAERAKAEAEAAAEDLRKKASLQNPDVMAFKAIFEQVQDDASKLMRVYARVKEKDAATAEKLKAAMGQMVKATFGEV